MKHRPHTTILLALVWLTVAALPAVAQTHSDYSWDHNPATGHYYALTARMSWAQAEADAVHLGGHLTTIEGLAENSWIYNQYAAQNEGSVWIGLSDVDDDDNWVWSSGSSSSFRNWGSGKPDNFGPDDHYVRLMGNNSPDPANWDDYKQTAFDLRGVIELDFDPFADTDGDGLLNGEEALLGTDIYDQDTDDDGLSDFIESQGVGPNWIQNPMSMNWYRLTDPLDWHAAEAQAVSWGGNLVSIYSSHENDWVEQTFAAYEPDGIWIGLQDILPGRYLTSWAWTSGLVYNYNQWKAGGPDRFGGDDFVRMLGSDSMETGNWDDYKPHFLLRGVVERRTANTPLLTDPLLIDSDGDGIQDGTELGLTFGTPDTNLAVFVPDADPSRTTDPSVADTDGGGLDDGQEDSNADGALGHGETDPSNLGDDTFFDLAVPIPLFRGVNNRVEAYRCTPNGVVMPSYSLRGFGSSPVPYGFNVSLESPVIVLPAMPRTDSGGFAQRSYRVPGNVPAGLVIYAQAFEFVGGSWTRLSQLVETYLQ